MGSLIILPLIAAITATGAYISVILGFFLASFAAMVTSMTALIALVLLM
jgi:hypothetical protein